MGGSSEALIIMRWRDRFGAGSLFTALAKQLEQLLSYAMPPETLRRQALGRVFPLGALYDARRDVFVSGFVTRGQLRWLNLHVASVDSSQCDSFSTDALSVDRQRRCFATHTCEDSFISRCNLLDVEANLRTNLLLFDTGVSGEFLLKSNRSHKNVTAALSVCLKTVKETLPESTKNKKLKDFLNEKAPIDEQATHVVVGIQWGARAIVELSTTTSHVQEAQSIHRKLRSVVAVTADNLNKRCSGSVFQTDVSNDFFKVFNFEVYGNITAPSRKLQTIDEALDFLREASLSHRLHLIIIICLSRFQNCLAVKRAFPYPTS